jgi:hypothetical protein
LVTRFLAPPKSCFWSHIMQIDNLMGGTLKLETASR